MVRKLIVKAVAVSALALTFGIVPATQALAWCGGCGYGGGYGNGNYGGNYAPSTQQSYAPQSYVQQPAGQPAQQSNWNNFDPTVFDIQTVLFEQGYYDGKLDGLYGSGTEAALLRFQEDNGIEKTENADVTALKVDTTTLEALGL